MKRAHIEDEPSTRQSGVAFVVTDHRRHRLCYSKRTDQGPRRYVIADLGPAAAPLCRTLGGAVLYWQRFKDVAFNECLEVKNRRGQAFRECRQWIRAGNRQRRADKHLSLLSPLLNEFAGDQSLVSPADLAAIDALLDSRRRACKALAKS